MVLLPYIFGTEPINSGDFVMVKFSVVKDGSPVKITWLFSSSDLLTSGTFIRQLKEKHTTLNVDPVLADGVGKYMCIMSNLAGITICTSHLKFSGVILSRFILLSSLCAVEKSGTSACHCMC